MIGKHDNSNAPRGRGACGSAARAASSGRAGVHREDLAALLEQDGDLVGLEHLDDDALAELRMRDRLAGAEVSRIEYERMAASLRMASSSMRRCHSRALKGAAAAAAAEAFDSLGTLVDAARGVAGLGGVRAAAVRLIATGAAAACFGAPILGA
jgi:hypothetical protein